MDAVFISDLHLQDERPELTEGFLRFCDIWGPQTPRLYILGDLFEVWIGDDVETSTSRAVTRALSSLAARGVKIAFVAGNRDFLIGDRFAETAHVKLLNDGAVEKISTQQVLLSHGDIYCTEDTEYQNFRKTLRDPRWISAFLQRPVAVRQQMAQALRKESVTQGKEKQQYLMDVAEPAILSAFDKSQTRLMIHGHVHRPAVHMHTLKGATCKRIVLGDWSDTGWMATIEGASSQLLKFPLKEPLQVRRCES